MWRISREGKAAGSLESSLSILLCRPGSPPTHPSCCAQVTQSCRHSHTIVVLRPGHSESRAGGKDLMESVYSESDPKKRKCGVGRVSPGNRRSQDEGVFP